MFLMKHFVINAVFLLVFLVFMLWFFCVGSGVFLALVSVFVFLLVLFLYWLVPLKDKGGDNYIKKESILYIYLWVYTEWVLMFSCYIPDWWTDFFVFAFLLGISHMALSYCEKLDLKPYSVSSSSKKGSGSFKLWK